MAIFSRSKATSRVPSFHVPGIRVPRFDWLRPYVASASAAMSGAGQQAVRMSGYAVSPSWWWAEITSATGVAVLLGLSVISLIVALIVTWPHH